MAACGSPELNGADLPCVMSDVREILKAEREGVNGKREEGENSSKVSPKGRCAAVKSVKKPSSGAAAAFGPSQRSRVFQITQQNPAVNLVCLIAVYQVLGGICLGQGLRQGTLCTDHNYTAVCSNDPHAYSPLPPTTFTKWGRCGR